MLQYKAGASQSNEQKMPYSQNWESKALKDFIGNDSWTIFKLLKIDSSFINLSVTEQATSDSYCHGKEVLAKLPVINDAAERALGLATDKYTKTAPKSEIQLQALYKVVNKGMREKLTTSTTELVTKRALSSVDYNWD